MTSRGRGKAAWIAGLLLTVGSVAAAEAVRRYLVPVPNPQLLVLV
ncbi:MAG: hypothetical protein RMM30_11725 [Armatimonadota bacterium]|nr:hypothetical protein [Armatimonadota bacterium]MDW8157240.1 hypothetical protein [Armatimonadota bacterium]